MIARHVFAPAGHANAWELGQVPIAMPMPSGSATTKSSSTRSTTATFLMLPSSLSDEVLPGPVEVAIGPRCLRRG